MSGSLVGVFILLGCGAVFQASARHALDHRTLGTPCTLDRQCRPIPNTRCKQYQWCSHGDWCPFHWRCPEHLAFNYETQTCDRDGNVDLSTCHALHRPQTATSSPVTTNHPTTHNNQTLDRYVECGDRRCYQGDCWYSFDCTGCPHYNFRCRCWPGYTGESCSQRIGMSESTTAVPLPNTPVMTTIASIQIDIDTTITSAKPASTTTVPVPNTTTKITAASVTATSPSTRPITSTAYSSQTQTTTSPIQLHHCNSTTTLTAIIHGTTTNKNNITSCASGSSATSEAFVLTHCQLPLSSNWKQGIKVQEHCNSITLYTPVATFNHDRYSSTGGLSGIFLGCIPDGFKIGVQKCDHPPTIIHVVNGGLFTMDPDVYFTVQ